MIFSQIFDIINIGLVILDKDMKVFKWNRWMEVNSGISDDEINGKPIFDFFPDLKTEKFTRSCKSVFTFGNFSFFSQKLHGYMFPFKLSGFLDSKFEYMQQTCAMGPLRDDNNEIKYLFIYVQDVTEVATYEQKLVEMNMMDSLTGVFNRRYLDKKLNEEFKRHKRYDRPLSIIMFDIDYFKKVNDIHGHQCGDFILKSVSSRVLSLIRNLDCMFRYGGEEFCCMLPETSIASAMMVAERFRIAVAELENNYDGKTVKVHISLGVAEITEEIDSTELLIKKADDALYRAKNEGRNRAASMQ
jgi:diguanylate cyclase (GGDEF)-like protein/PAS domain S-box-containing protein